MTAPEELTERTTVDHNAGRNLANHSSRGRIPAWFYVYVPPNRVSDLAPKYTSHTLNSEPLRIELTHVSEEPNFIPRYRLTSEVEPGPVGLREPLWLKFIL